MATQKTKQKKVKISLKRSLIGRKPLHIKIAKALGLIKMHKTKEHYLSPSILGMVKKIDYMVMVEDC